MKPPEHLYPRHPWSAWLLSALVAIGCSTFAFLQAPAIDADAPPAGWRALLQPLERNAWLRIQHGQALQGSTELVGVQAGRDGASAWVAVSDGSVLRTTDGGGAWRSARVPLSAGAALSLLRMGADGRGWALDSAGALYTTRDGGDAWEPERLGDEACVHGLAVSPNGQRALALGETGFWEWRAGESWIRLGTFPVQATKAPAPERPIPLFLADSGAHAAAWPTRLVRVSAEGMSAVPLPADLHPRALFLGADGKRLLLAGGDGTLRSLDGDTLRVDYRDPDGALYDLDARGGWAVGARGHVVSSRAGTSWLVAPRAGGSTLTAISMAPDGRRGWAASGATFEPTTLPGTGTLWHTADGGETWHRQLVLSESFTLRPLDKDGAAQAVTSTGASLKSVDGGETWTVTATAGAAPAPGPSNAPTTGQSNAPNAAPAPPLCGERRCPLRAVADARGWAVDETGALLYSRDGGKTWTPQARSSLALTGIEGGLRQGRPLFIGTDGRRLYRAEGDGGWEAVRYSWWPAPWYFASLLVVALLVRASLRTPAPRLRESVADLLVTDKPIENVTDDVLGIHELAQGISRFIRNDQTQPSLTLAVTGEWGTGKSSVLNLLQADLRRFGFAPVWFNAWHHESEESLIAALYARIISQGTPTQPSWEAVAFRWRLLRRQTRGLSTIFLASLLLLTTGTGYFLARQEHLTDLLQHARHTAEAISGYLSSTTEAKPQAQPTSHYEVELQRTEDGGWKGSLETQAPPSATQGHGDTDPPAQWLAALSTLLGLAGIGRALLERLKAFGVDPSRLAASLAGSDRAKDHQESVGFHARFAKDFGDVTRALAPRRMVLLVDDLDRRSPESTLKMLEAINFLVTSGECFVVMAISDTVVQEYLGSQFRDVAETFPALGTDTPHDRRLAYARKYLEKLINVEVKLPPMQKEQAQELLHAPPRLRGPARARSAEQAPGGAGGGAAPARRQRPGRAGEDARLPGGDGGAVPGSGPVRRLGGAAPGGPGVRRSGGDGVRRARAGGARAVRSGGPGHARAEERVSPPVHGVAPARAGGQPAALVGVLERLLRRGDADLVDHPPARGGGAGLARLPGRAAGVERRHHREEHHPAGGEALPQPGALLRHAPAHRRHGRTGLPQQPGGRVAGGHGAGRKPAGQGEPGPDGRGPPPGEAAAPAPARGGSAIHPRTAAGGADGAGRGRAGPPAQARLRGAAQGGRAPAGRPAAGAGEPPGGRRRLPQAHRRRTRRHCRHLPPHVRRAGDPLTAAPSTHLKPGRRRDPRRPAVRSGAVWPVRTLRRDASEW